MVLTTEPNTIADNAMVAGNLMEGQMVFQVVQRLLTRQQHNKWPVAVALMLMSMSCGDALVITSAEPGTPPSLLTTTTTTSDGDRTTTIGSGGSTPTIGSGGPTTTETTPPAADFVFEEDETVAGLFHFEDGSDGGPFDRYDWDFGDGSKSEEVNPSHTYATSGDWLVRLQVVRSDGELATTSKTVSFVVRPEPKPEPEARFDCAEPDGLQVSCNSTSTGGPFTSVAWGWGDGSSSDEPSHRYQRPGDYEIILEVVNESGTDSAAVDVSVTLDVPVADFGCEIADLDVTCENLSSGQPFGSVRWDWGDGTEGTVSSHTYRRAGTYDIVLTVTNPAGSDESSGSVTVVEKPSARIDCRQTSPLTIGCLVAAVTGGPFSTVVWDFGDNKTTQQSTEPTDVDHVYTRVGDYDVRLTLANRSGTTEATSSVTVVGSPTAVITESERSGARLQFVSDSTGGPFDSVLWEFGDGTTSTAENPPPHLFPLLGSVSSASGPVSYTVRLTVEARGETDTDEIDVDVSCAPSAAVLREVIGNGGLDLRLSVSPAPTCPVSSVSWYLSGLGLDATGPEIEFRVPGTGRYDYEVRVKNGSEVSFVDDSVAAIAEPDFAVDPFYGAPSTLAFAAITDLDPSAFSVAWDFGDGATDTVPNPTHTYAGGCSPTSPTEDDATVTLTIEKFGVTASTNRVVDPCQNN